MIKALLLVAAGLLAAPLDARPEDGHIEKPSKLPEAEFLFSGSFQGISLVQPITKNFQAEARLYRSPELHEDVMVLGASRRLGFVERLTKGKLQIFPGLNIFAGRDEITSPAFSLRYSVLIMDKRSLQIGYSGSLFQAVLATTEGTRDTHIDLNKVDLNFRKFSLFPLAWEFVQYRAEQEFKLGFGGSIKIRGGWKLMTMLFLPPKHGYADHARHKSTAHHQGKWELRGGIVLSPER